MIRIDRKKGSFRALQFKVKISAIGKTISDIADIIFVVKEDFTDTDVNALLLKKATDGVIWAKDTNGDIDVSVPWLYNEYDSFTIDKIYFGGLFCKFNGDPIADENVKELYEVRITQDMLEQ